MTIYKLLSLNKNVLICLSNSGVTLNDYQYIELFEEYTKMFNEGLKTTYIVTVLSDKYKVSERKIYSIIKRVKSAAQ